jgi:hypothetical protein
MRTAGIATSLPSGSISAAIVALSSGAVDEVAHRGGDLGWFVFLDEVGGVGDVVAEGLVVGDTPFWHALCGAISHLSATNRA